MDAAKIQEIREAWQKESDEWLLKAATKDIEEYSPEVCVIIREEAVKRGLIAYKIKEARLNGLEFEPTIAEKGQDLLADVEERSPKIVSVKLAKTIIVFLSVAAVFGLVGLIFGVPQGILVAAGAYVVYTAVQKIWPSEEERKIRRQQSKQISKWMEDHPEKTEELIRKTTDDFGFDEIFKNRKDNKTKDE